MLSDAARLKSGGGVSGFVVMAVFATALSAAIWWLDEGMGVRCLRHRREQFLASAAGTPPPS